MLSYWCEMAEIDVTCVIDRARTLLSDYDAGQRDRAGAAEVHCDARRSVIRRCRSAPH
jgi:hypothetical protein